MTPGAYIGHYQLGPRLGAGGMGEVYRAIDTRTGHPVAVKLLHPELLRDPEARARAQAELQALFRLRSHPHIVTVFDFVADPFAIVTELLEGVTFEAVLADTPRLPVPWILGHFRDLVRAVAYAHSEGILHRDLKPANIMLVQVGHEQIVKVLDFGLARLGEQSHLTRPGQRMGTVHFMAPEQHLGQATDPRTDVYCLGVLLHTLCAGHPPFFDLTSDYAVMKAHLDQPLPALGRVRADVPPWLDALIRRACAKQPDDRYASARALLEALEVGMAQRGDERPLIAGGLLSEQQPPAERPFAVERPFVDEPPSWMTRPTVPRSWGAVLGALALTSLVVIAQLPGLTTDFSDTASGVAWLTLGAGLAALSRPSHGAGRWLLALAALGAAGFGATLIGLVLGELLALEPGTILSAWLDLVPGVTLATRLILLASFGLHLLTRRHPVAGVLYAIALATGVAPLVGSTLPAGIEGTLAATHYLALGLLLLRHRPVRR